MMEKEKRKRGKKDDYPYRANPFMPLLMVGLVLVLAVVPFLIGSQVIPRHYWWQYMLRDYIIFYYAILTGVMCLLPFVFSFFVLNNFTHQVYGRRSCLVFIPIVLGGWLGLLFSGAMCFGTVSIAEFYSAEHVETLSHDGYNYHLSEEILKDTSGGIHGSTIKIYRCETNDTGCSHIFELEYLYGSMKVSLLIENDVVHACFVDGYAYLVPLPSEYEGKMLSEYLHPVYSVQEHPQCR